MGQGGRSREEKLYVLFAEEGNIFIKASSIQGGGNVATKEGLLAMKRSVLCIEYLSLRQVTQVTEGEGNLLRYNAS